MTASMLAATKQKITTEEEAKAALAERRRLAREQAERDAELERQRLVRYSYICSVVCVLQIILLIVGNKSKYVLIIFKLSRWEKGVNNIAIVPITNLTIN